MRVVYNLGIFIRFHPKEICNVTALVAYSMLPTVIVHVLRNTTGKRTIPVPPGNVNIKLPQIHVLSKI